MGQGNDRGTQYRSGIYPTTAQQQDVAENSLGAYQSGLSSQTITTEIMEHGSVEFY